VQGQKTEQRQVIAP